MAIRPTFWNQAGRLINVKIWTAGDYEHPDQGNGPAALAFSGMARTSRNSLLALPGPGDRIANGPNGGITNI